MTFKIVTDSCCDLPYQFLKENDVAFISMTITIHDQELVDDLGETFDYDTFLQSVREGALPTTSQVNAGRYLEFFRPFVERKEPVLYLAFSSGLSGSYQSALQAVDMLKEEYGDVAIHVVDTKAASLGQGLLVYQAIELKKNGQPIEKVLKWVEDNKMSVQSWVTVDDLKHLERGGRISKTTAAIGGLMNIKPIITVDAEGKLQNVGKVRGRSKSIKKVVDETVSLIKEPQEQTLFIAYAGDKDSADKAKALLQEELQTKEILLYPLGPTIASHTGYGCIAIFSLGAVRA